MNGEIDSWIIEKGVKFLKRIGIRKGQKVLDFGSRKGNYTIPAAKIVRKNGLVYAIDKDSEVLEELQKRVNRLKVENIKPIKTSGKIKIPLKENFVDVVLLYDVIHLVGKEDSSTVKDRKKLYQEVRRVLKADGLLSVYPTHLDTHTDVNSIEEIKKEIENSGFHFEESFSETLIHDDNLTKGKVLNFRKM